MSTIEFSSPNQMCARLAIPSVVHPKLEADWIRLAFGFPRLSESSRGLDDLCKAPAIDQLRASLVRWMTSITTSPVPVTPCSVTWLGTRQVEAGWFSAALQGLGYGHWDPSKIHINDT